MKIQMVSWKMLENLLRDNLMINTMTVYAVERWIDRIIMKIKGKHSNTLDEQIFLCLDKALEELCKDYVLEYDLVLSQKFINEIVKNKNMFSKMNLKKILENLINLEVDEEILEHWLFLVNRVISEERLEMLRDYILLQNELYEKKDKIYPRILTAKPAFPPEEYLERKEKELILCRLKESKKLVLVNGIGGVGKSTVCRKLFHEFSENSDRTLAWVVYNEKSIEEDLRKQLFYPYEGKNWRKQFIQFLQQDIEEEAILFIDNLNVSEEEDPFLKELANANCNVVCTSRVTKFQHYEVVPVDFFEIEDCIKLFYSYYKLEYDYEKIKRIVKRAGQHTLAIEVLGKLGNAERCTLDMIESKLIKEGFDMEGIVSIETREDSLIGHLCRTFNVKKLNNEQKAILYCLAMLPTQRISLQLKNWLGLQNSYNINYLVRFAWFIKDDKGYYMHPVIKEVAKRVIDCQEEVLLQLLLGIEKELDYEENPKYEYSMMLISYVESILPNLAIESQGKMTQLMYNISVLYAQFGNYEKALEYIDSCIATLEKDKADVEFLALAYNHKGYIYFYKEEDKKSEEYYKKAYVIQKKLKNKKRLAQTTSSLALLYQEMWKIMGYKKSAEAKKMLNDAVRYQKEAINIMEGIFAGKKHANMASAYNNMAALQNSLKNYEMAVFYYKKAETIRINLQDAYIVDLAVTYFGLGQNYIDMANTESKMRRRFIQFKLAVFYLEKSKEIRISQIRKGNQKLKVENVIKSLEEVEKKIKELEQCYTYV